MIRFNRTLAWMTAFLVLVGILVVLVHARLLEMFNANPFFNGVILSVLVAGIIANLRQVAMLSGEARWMESFRRSNPERPVQGQARLLAPMARMLGNRTRDRAALSAHSMRALLDGVQSRLDESRDVSRYLIGLAIFLGLLGTFWGLLVTIRSVSDIIGSLNVGNDAVSMFGALKENLKHPLAGMSTSFSTSLFGLASSLVIGFLDLQAGHAQNRFYNALEEWLSGMTHLSSGNTLEGDASVPAYVQALLEQTADGLERMQRAIVENERERRGSHEQFAEVSTQLTRLNDLLSRDARERQAAAQVQDELKTVLRQIASQAPAESRLSDDLRSELRLLSRTIAAAVGERREPRP